MLPAPKAVGPRGRPCRPLSNKAAGAVTHSFGGQRYGIGQKRIFLLIHCRYPPGHLSCSMPPSISISFRANCLGPSSI
jgi:hypothetical protein